MKQVRSTTADTRGRTLILLVILMLAGLPVAVWLDLRNLTETSLLRQAKDLNSVVSSMRGLLRQQRGRPRAGLAGLNPGGAQLREYSRRHSDSCDALARTRSSHQRTAAEHQLPLRLGLSVQEPRPART